MSTETLDTAPAAPPVPPPPPEGPDSPWGIRDFRLLWFGRVVAVLAIQIQSSALLWQVYEIARRDHPIEQASLYLGLVGLCQFLPLLAFTLPAAVALFVIPFFIIDATVTRGAFTSADAARTADVLRQFAWGVPAFVLAKVLTPPFFARQDTRRPMIFAVVSVVITVVLGSGLFFWFGAQGWDGVLGLAVATSVSAWINVGLLAGVLVRENSWRPSPAFVSRLSRVLAASAFMAGLLLLAGINYGLLSRLFLAKEIAVLVVCGLGAGVYGVCLLAFRAVTVAELKATLRREPGGSAASGLD